MKIKYRSGYAEGGFLDDGASVDPVSGNEVPSGSLAEEVRDDVPAQLSEGEFVVPADVVRFIGLDKLMKMRNAAKAGLADMEAEGQMGGAPMMSEGRPHEMAESDSQEMSEDMSGDDLEMDALIDGMDGEDFEGTAQRFAEGGSVIPSYETYTGRTFNDNATVEYTSYTNAAGDIIKIKTLKGKPLEEVPEGYYKVGTESTGGTAETTPVDTVRVNDSQGGGGVGERNREYQNSIQRTNEENKSLRITQERSSVLNALHKDNMSQEEVDKLFSSMTPMAQAEYDNRFRDPKYVDKYMSEGKSPVELMIIAQKTVDLRNRLNGNLEPNSSSLPTGEPIDITGSLEGLYKAFVATKAGLLALKDLGEDGVLSKLIKGEEERKGNNTQPTVTAKPTQFNQAHWRSRMAELGKAGVSASDIQKQLLAEQRAVVANSGGTVDAYGNKIMREPGQPAPRTIWDDIAEVQANQQNTIDVNVERARKAEALLQNKRGFDPADVYTPADGTEYQPEGTGVTASTQTLSQEVVDRDEKILDEMGVGELKTPTATATSLWDTVEDDLMSSLDVEGGQIEADKLRAGMDLRAAVAAEPTIEEQEAARLGTAQVEMDKLLAREDMYNTLSELDAEDKAFYQDQYDKQLEKQLNENQNFFDEVALTNKENASVAFTPKSTGATLGKTGVLGKPGENIYEAPPTIANTGLGEPDEDAIRDLAVSLGVDPQAMVDRWKADNASNNTDPVAVDTVNVISKRQQDKIERDNRAKQAKALDKARKDQAAIDAAAAAAADAQNNLPPDPIRGGDRGNNTPSGPVGGSTTGPKTRGNRQRQERSQQQTRSSNVGGVDRGLNARSGMYIGGLATKKKPEVKKMRNDPTSGLASKKKAKQKAQAKKGALAAKRT